MASTKAKQLTATFARAATALQVDRTLMLALAARVWQAASGPVTIALVIATLSPGQQGIYYTLVTIVGIQAFFELGLLNVLISQAGHAQASIDSDLSDDASRWRLQHLVTASRRWFAGAAVAFAFTALGFGWLTYRQSDAPAGWQLPLLLVVPLAGVCVFLSPMIALLEGVGRRQFVYRLRLIQMVVGSLTVWICLSSGLGLWALVFATLAQALCFVAGARQLDRQVARQLRELQNEPTAENQAAGQSFRWMTDVLPAQWRLALISAAYHFATQLFPLIVLTFHGTVEAGRLGMTLTVTTAIQMLALSWIQTKYSVAARQHGSGDRERAGVMWQRTTLVSAGVMVLGFGVLAALIPSLTWIRPDLPQRFIAPSQVLWLGLGAVGNLGVSAQSFYALSRGRPPFLVPSLIGCGVVGGAVWGSGYLYGVNGIVISYAVATVAVFLPLHTAAYLGYRRGR